MLHEFLTTNRDEIIARARAKVAMRAAPRATEPELKNGIPLFLNQLIEKLRLSMTSNEEINRSAVLHGEDMLRMGFTVAQVVHDYGDLCQVVTELAQELKAPITTDEFHTFNGCLDHAIAHAVSEHARLRESSLTAQGVERMGVLAHELRNLLNSALLAFDLLKKGNVGPSGSTGAVLGRSLIRLKDLINRSLTEVRLETPVRCLETFSMDEFMEEIEIAAVIDANGRGLRLTVTPGESGVMIKADRQILAAAVANLLQNALKFTRPHGQVSLTTRSTADHVLIDIEDECGGLPAGKIDELFLPFKQRGANRTGMGLGLSISRKAVESSGGEIHVHDLPGRGCIFTIDLPRQPLPPP